MLTLFLAEIFYFFICFKHACKCLWKHFMMTALKIFADNSNIPVIFILALLIIFFIQVEIFPILGLTSEYFHWTRIFFILWDAEFYVDLLSQLASSDTTPAGRRWRHCNTAGWGRNPCPPPNRAGFLTIAGWGMESWHPTKPPLILHCLGRVKGPCYCFSYGAYWYHPVWEGECFFIDWWGVRYRLLFYSPLKPWVREAQAVSGDESSSSYLTISGTTAAEGCHSPCYSPANVQVLIPHLGRSFFYGVWLVEWLLSECFLSC